MKKLSLGIVGSGQVAESVHLSNYLKEDVEIVALCDINEVQAKRVGEKFGIKKVYTDYKKMLEENSLDIVTVCVPNKFHCEIVIEALEKGANVLCEKPPSITYEEALKMTETAERNGKILAYNFHFRHSNEVKMLKKMASEGGFGDIYAGRVQALRRRGIPGWGVFTNKDIQGGGALIDIGIHMLDTALYLMGYPKVDYVSATTYDLIGKKGGIGLMGKWNPETFTVEDAAFGFIKFKNGSSIVLETSFALNMKEKKIMNVNIFGDKAGASVFPAEIYSENQFTVTDTVVPFIEETDMHHGSIKNFIASCRGEEEIISKARQGLEIQRIIEAMYKSAQLGESIKL